MMESSDNHVRPKSGWLMIVAGWALGLLVITYYFSHVLEKQNNPNTLSVLSGQVGELVLETQSQRSLYRRRFNKRGAREFFA